MNELSLFSGAGGGLLGTKLLGWRSVGYVENNTYCQKILAQRIEDGFLDEAPIFGDIDDFIESGAAKKYKGYVDVVTAGFPCQPFSVAGKKKGQDDERNKWPQTIQCIRDVGCRYALLENVPGLLNSGYFPEILRSLAEAGFDARWTVLGADDVGAPHRRKRLWILADSDAGRIQPEEEVCTRRDTFDDGNPYVAYPNSGSHGRGGTVGSGGENQVRGLHPTKEEQTGQHIRGEAVGRSVVRGEKDVADSGSLRRSPNEAGRNTRALEGAKGQTQEEGAEQAFPPHSSSEDEADSDSAGQSASYWPAEPQPICRVAHGVAHRVDMLKALGNGQVPRVVATAWRILNDSDVAVIKKTPR